MTDVQWLRRMRRGLNVVAVLILAMTYTAVVAAFITEDGWRQIVGPVAAFVLGTLAAVITFFAVDRGTPLPSQSPR